MSGGAKSRRAKSKLWWAALLVLCGSPTVAFAQTGHGGKPWTWALGAKGGAFLGGEVYIEPAHVDAETGPMLGVFADSIVVPGFSIGAFTNFANTGVGPASASIFNLGVSMKARFQAGDLSLRPGLTFGYQQITGDFETITGFDPGLVFELGVPVSATTGVLFDVGFFSQPVGGNELASVTFGPKFYLAAGIEFGG